MIYFRDGVSLLLKTLSTCWSIVANDYGTVVSALLALTTFAALFFLIFVLHRTLASRTPEHQRQLQHSRNGEKHRRKKRKHVHTRGHKASQKSPSALPQQHVDSVDSIGNSDSQISKEYADDMLQQLLPPLAEDAPLENPPSTLFHLSTLSVKNLEPSTAEQSHSMPSLTVDTFIPCSVDDQSSCSGRSTPTPAVANEISHPAFLSNPEENLDALKTYNLAYSRRAVNPRRGGKKVSGDGVGGASPPPVPIPSKRWDVLKPSSRTTPRCRTPQRFPVSTKSRSIPRTHLREESKAPRVTEDRHPFEHTVTDSVSSYEGPEINVVINGDVSVGPSSLRLDDRSCSNDRRQQQFDEVSTLNPLSPSWTGSLSLTPAGGCPPRNDPILSPQLGFDAFHRENVPFGYGIHQCPQATGAPDGFPQYMPSHYQSSFPVSYPPHPSTTNAYGAMFAPTVDPPSSVSDLYAQHISHAPIVRENPFATNDDDDDRIEAELQALGGRMVGSILDF
jgi:hypothetical protein